MKKRLSMLLACLLIIVTVAQVTQGVSLAYNFAVPHRITTPLWNLTRHQLYPNSIFATGQTTRVYAVWLGTQTHGNGSDWTMVSRDPGNGATIDISRPAWAHYTHVAIIFAHRNGASRFHSMNNVSVTGTSMSTNEVYDSRGVRITTGLIEFVGGNVIIPLAAGSNSYWLSTLHHSNGWQDYNINLWR